MGKPHQGKLTPFACFTCRKSFKRKEEPGVFERACPSCGGVAYRLFQKFKAPRSTDLKHWDVVAYLYQHGFWFQSVSGCHEYPRTLEEARQFVQKFKDHAVTRARVTW